MPYFTRILYEVEAKYEGKPLKEVLSTAPFWHLTPSELYVRLLTRSRLVKRLFPKTAFLVALDN